MKKRQQTILTVAFTLGLSAIVGLAARAQDEPPPPLPDRAGGFERNPGFPPMQPMEPTSPEIMKKTRTILVLREFVAAGLTAENIRAALPPLKAVREAEKQMQAQTESLLDEQIKTTLAAQSISELGSDLSRKMRALSDDFRQKQREGWETVQRSIGSEKTIRLQWLVMFGGPPRPVYPGGNGVLPGRPPRDGGRPGGGRPEAPQRVPRFEDNRDEIYQPPVRGPRAEDLSEQPPQPRSNQPDGPPGARFGQPLDRMDGRGGFGQLGPRVSLAELIDLLEMRLSALQK